MHEGFWKITKKGQKTAKLKEVCRKALQDLKEARQAFSEARQELVTLKGKWDQLDHNHGDPVSGFSQDPEGHCDTQMESGTEGDTDCIARTKRPRPVATSKPSFSTFLGTRLQARGRRTPSVLSDNKSSCQLNSD